MLDLVKAELLPKWICDAIRSTGSQRPRMYGLPKTHKEGAPLRSILSMTGSSHHELDKWLAGLLQPVLEQFSSHCISDSFTFAKTMQNLDINPNVFMCFFDVSSLFTNVSLDETIIICSGALYSLIHAYELMLGLHVFRQTGPPRRVDCLAPPSVFHMKTEASR